MAQGLLPSLKLLLGKDGTNLLVTRNHTKSATIAKPGASPFLLETSSP